MVKRWQARVKRRVYRSAVREEGAADTRRRILDAARALFVEQGYDAMTMTAIADNAGVALDTVYETVGKKPLLARLLVETAISNTDDAVPAAERDYVRAIKAAPDARTKLRLYAAAVVDIHGRLAPIVRALQVASARHRQLGAIWDEISTRRARNMRLLAAELIETGETRPELDVAQIADYLWSLGAPDLYLLFREQRGWSAPAIETWVADTWIRLLLRS